MKDEQESMEIFQTQIEGSMWLLNKLNEKRKTDPTTFWGVTGAATATAAAIGLAILGKELKS